MLLVPKAGLTLVAALLAAVVARHPLHLASNLATATSQRRRKKEGLDVKDKGRSNKKKKEGWQRMEWEEDGKLG